MLFALPFFYKNYWYHFGLSGKDQLFFKSSVHSLQFSVHIVFSHKKLTTADCQLRTANCQLRTANCPLRTALCQSRKIENHRFS